jgi:hypothetical protein
MKKSARKAPRARQRIMSIEVKDNEVVIETTGGLVTVDATRKSGHLVTYNPHRGNAPTKTIR